jgi:hypothetical protein
MASPGTPALGPGQSGLAALSAAARRGRADPALDAPLIKVLDSRILNSARPRPLRLAASIAAALAFASAPAAADLTKDQCVDANGKGQELRREGMFSAARVQLRQCATPSCPAMVRDDCTRRLDELERAQPTIVFEVKDAAGVDVIDVRVSADGQPLVAHLSGKPVNVDPGAHEFTFEVAGKPPVTERVLVSEGEIGRRERVVIGTAPVAASAPASPSSAPLSTSEPSTPPSSGLGARKVIGLSIGGVGVVGVGVGAVFGLMASSAWSHAKSACGGDPTRCNDVTSGNSYRDTTQTDGTISTIGFIAGGVLVAAGAIVLFTGAHHEQTSATGVVVAPSLGPGLAGVALKGAF